MSSDFKEVNGSDHRDSDPGTTTLRRLREMDNPAWAKLTDRHFDRVYRWCLDAGIDAHTSADIAQEVFVSLLGSLHRFKRGSESTFTGWLRRITQRRIADYLRRRRDTAVGGTDAAEMFSQLASVRQTLQSEPPADNESLEFDDHRLLEAIAAVQSEFESDTWQAFWMTTVEGRRVLDVALELGMTRNAVYLAKSRILKRLRVSLRS